MKHVMKVFLFGFNFLISISGWMILFGMLLMLANANDAITWHATVFNELIPELVISFIFIIFSIFFLFYLIVSDLKK